MSSLPLSGLHLYLDPISVMQTFLHRTWLIDLMRVGGGGEGEVSSPQDSRLLERSVECGDGEFLTLYAN